MKPIRFSHDSLSSDAVTTLDPAHRELGAVMLGMGTSLPNHRVKHQISAQFAGLISFADPAQARKVSALYRRSGIEYRGSVLLDSEPVDGLVSDFYPPATSAEDRGPTTKSRSDRYAVEAPILAVEASTKALSASGIRPDEITHLVTVTCTGFSAPGIDITLIDTLGLPTTTERVQVGFMGCHGAINGLRTARGLVAASPNAKVLMCSVELCSLHFQYGYDADRIVSGALFADGAAALVLEAESADSGSVRVNRDAARNPQRSDAETGDPLGVVGIASATGSALVPESRDAMTWRIGDHGYEMTLSPKVPGLINEHLVSFLEPWLASQGESIESIQGWAVHPGGSRILSAVETTLGLSREDLAASRGVLSDHGNMSSATMLFILQRFAAMEQPKPWLMLGFGPGLEIEVALIR